LTAFSMFGVSQEPLRVFGEEKKIMQISAGYNHSCAITGRCLCMLVLTFKNLYLILDIFFSYKFCTWLIYRTSFVFDIGWLLFSSKMSI